jgi:hypothetical protein
MIEAVGYWFGVTAHVRNVCLEVLTELENRDFIFNCVRGQIFLAHTKQREVAIKIYRSTSIKVPF